MSLRQAEFPQKGLNLIVFSYPKPWSTSPMKKMMNRWWVYQNTSKYDLRITSMDDVMMRMRASVMATPVSPAMVVNMTMVGFCTETPSDISLFVTFKT